MKEPSDGVRSAAVSLLSPSAPFAMAAQQPLLGEDPDFTNWFQQGEIEEMERTLNYIYSVVQTSERKVQATQEDVWAVSNLIVAVYEDEEGEQ